LRLGDQALLKRLGVVDDVIEEPMGGAQNSPEEAAKSVGKAVRSHLAELVKLSKEQLLEKRYARYRALG
jgi:acetyl-CoA carboxylase carboxyl transferase subunit alpha